MKGNTVLVVQNEDELNSLQDCQEGKIIFIKDTETYVMYKDGEWSPIDATMNSAGMQMNLYEFNKQIICQLPDFEDSQWEGAEKIFLDWIEKQTNHFYMLYGREINYFTVFQSVEDKSSEYNSLFSAMRACLESIGIVKAIDIVEDNTAVEIWIYREENATCLYLFPYDEGVVNYNE